MRNRKQMMFEDQCEKKPERDIIRFWSKAEPDEERGVG
jgi:hypothetical protein